MRCMKNIVIICDIMISTNLIHIDSYGRCQSILYQWISMFHWSPERKKRRQGGHRQALTELKSLWVPGSLWDTNVLWPPGKFKACVTWTFSRNNSTRECSSKKNEDVGHARIAWKVERWIDEPLGVFAKLPADLLEFCIAGGHLNIKWSIVDNNEWQSWFKKRTDIDWTLIGLPNLPDAGEVGEVVDKAYLLCSLSS